MPSLPVVLAVLVLVVVLVSLVLVLLVLLVSLVLVVELVRVVLQRLTLPPRTVGTFSYVACAPPSACPRLPSVLIVFLCGYVHVLLRRCRYLYRV